MVGHRDRDSSDAPAGSPNTPRSLATSRLKYAALIVFAVVVASILLSLRQHRLETAHDMARLYDEIHRHRQSLWRLQTQIATGLQPAQLHSAIERAQLQLEPWTTTPPPPAPQAMVANQSVQRHD